MTSKECLERLVKIAYVEPGPTKEKFITYAREIEHNKKCLDLYNTIKQDRDRLEKLENENEKLKERYKHRAAISNELNEALNQYEKALEILRDNVQITLYDKDSWVENYGINVKMILDYEIRFLTQEQYKLLKEVLGNE